MEKKLSKIHENLIAAKLTFTQNQNHTFNAKSYNTIKHKHTYNFPAFSAENNLRNNGFTYLYALSRIRY